MSASRIGVGAVLIAVCCLALLHQTPAAGAGRELLPTLACTGRWQVVSGPNPSTISNQLFGVDAFSSTDVWAVGQYFDNITHLNSTLAEHWDGTSWTVVPTPNAGTFDALQAVAAVATSDVWAVGYASPSLQTTTLIEHWNGEAWTVVPSPSPGVESSVLAGVAAVSSDDVWAVGYSTDAGGKVTTLIEHWDGSVWTVVPSPSPGAAQSGLSGVFAAGELDVWAVGSSSDDNRRFKTLVEHWDGAAWSVVPSPNRGQESSGLADISGSSSSDLWAVGSFVNSSGVVSTLIEHWDGSKWTAVPSPSPGASYSSLLDVAAPSASLAWAVGSQATQTGVFKTLIEQWDGGQWRTVRSPNVGTQGNALSGLSADSTSDAWAVGEHDLSRAKTLFERFCE